MNEIIKAMEERRSIRKFQPAMPTKDDLAQIVEAGLYAASGMGRQSAIIVAVAISMPAIREKIAFEKRRSAARQARKERV